MFLHIIDRKTAIAAGLNKYFTGTPCKNGGFSERYTNSRKCLCEICSSISRSKCSAYYSKNRIDLVEKKRIDRINRPDTYAGRDREKYAKSREVQLAKKVDYYRENRESILEKSRSRSVQNRAAVLKIKREAYRRNPQAQMARNAKRAAAKHHRTPSWFGELDHLVAAEAVSLARERSNETGIKWHVDHMVPLRSSKASGLHCAANLQVIPAAMNLSKNSRMVMTWPLQWLRWVESHHQQAELT